MEMEIHTQRLRITPCTEKILQITLRADGYEIAPHVKNYLEEYRIDPSLMGWGVWVVIEKEEEKIVGDIGFKGKPDFKKTVEVGYGIVPSAQNKGYATEAVRAIIDWALTSVNVEKILAECHVDNIASIRVLEKINMQKCKHDKEMLKWQLNKLLDER
ncbi:GNAT family N-acetyltransferase [Oceanobacillus picturae]|jgi:[ribosomal protein S5]-alanine N-acetyltransferase|uniref:GNAT family N-acetyltransferase n=1 Tax=Oceanobacillus picturae TaxID=171693 RepID=UPI00362B24C9